MPEVKNIFVGAKMNKDLNPRMISNQEYIDARNAAVMNSESGDSGLLQNVSGNTLLTDFGLTGINLEIIGFYTDTTSNRLFAFVTDWNDVSGSGLSNFASSLLEISNKAPRTYEFFLDSISAALNLLLKVNIKFFNLIFFKKILSLHLFFI